MTGLKILRDIDSEAMVSKLISKCLSRSKNYLTQAAVPASSFKRNNHIPRHCGVLMRIRRGLKLQLLKVNTDSLVDIKSKMSRIP